MLVKKPKSAERGVAAVEFVLIFPLLLLILWSLLDFGLLLNARLVVTTTTRDGARRAAIEGGATPNVFKHISESLQAGGLNPELAEIEIRPEQAAYGSNITVSVTYPYRFLTGVVESLGSLSVPLRAEMTTRSEKLRPR